MNLQRQKVHYCQGDIRTLSVYDVKTFLNGVIQGRVKSKPTNNKPDLTVSKTSEGWVVLGKF